jgi:hypothetical protein
MDSDRITALDRRTRLGYISLSDKEEQYVRATIDSMNQNGMKIGKNVGGKLARLSILLMCDLFNSGKIKKTRDCRDEELFRKDLQAIITKISK